MASRSSQLLTMFEALLRICRKGARRCTRLRTGLGVLLVASAFFHGRWTVRGNAPELVVVAKGRR